MCLSVQCTYSVITKITGIPGSINCFFPVMPEYYGGLRKKVWLLQKAVGGYFALLGGLQNLSGE